MGLITDKNDPGLHDIQDSGQQRTYLVLSKEEKAKGFIRPVRRSYKHLHCGGVTSMPQSIAETYARDPSFYGATFCCICRKHYPLVQGVTRTFVWDDGTGVGE